MYVNIHIVIINILLYKNIAVTKLKYTHVFCTWKKLRLSKLVYDSENVVHVSCVLRPNTNSLYYIMLILDIQKIANV